MNTIATSTLAITSPALTNDSKSTQKELYGGDATQFTSCANTTAITTDLLKGTASGTYTTTAPIKLHSTSTTAATSLVLGGGHAQGDNNSNNTANSPQAAQAEEPTNATAAEHAAPATTANPDDKNEPNPPTVTAAIIEAVQLSSLSSPSSSSSSSSRSSSTSALPLSSSTCQTVTACDAATDTVCDAHNELHPRSNSDSTGTASPTAATVPPATINTVAAVSPTNPGTVTPIPLSAVPSAVATTAALKTNAVSGDSSALDEESYIASPTTPQQSVPTATSSPVADSNYSSSTTTLPFSATSSTSTATTITAEPLYNIPTTTNFEAAEPTAVPKMTNYDAAVCVQSHWRKLQAQRFFQFESLIRAVMTARQLAAVEVQRYWLGYKVRRAFNGTADGRRLKRLRLLLQPVLLANQQPLVAATPLARACSSSAQRLLAEGCGAEHGSGAARLGTANVITEAQRPPVQGCAYSSDGAEPGHRCEGGKDSICTPDDIGTPVAATGGDVQRSNYENSNSCNKTPVRISDYTADDNSATNSTARDDVDGLYRPTGCSTLPPTNGLTESDGLSVELPDSAAVTAEPRLSQQQQRTCTAATANADATSYESNTIVKDTNGVHVVTTVAADLSVVDSSKGQSMMRSAMKEQQPCEVPQTPLRGASAVHQPVGLYKHNGATEAHRPARLFNSTLSGSSTAVGDSSSINGGSWLYQADLDSSFCHRNTTKAGSRIVYSNLNSKSTAHRGWDMASVNGRVGNSNSLPDFTRFMDSGSSIVSNGVTIYDEAIIHSVNVPPQQCGATHCSADTISLCGTSTITVDENSILYDDTYHPHISDSTCVLNAAVGGTQPGTLTSSVNTTQYNDRDKANAHVYRIAETPSNFKYLNRNLYNSRGGNPTLDTDYYANRTRAGKSAFCGTTGGVHNFISSGGNLPTVLRAAPRVLMRSGSVGASMCTDVASRRSVADAKTCGGDVAVAMT